MSILLLELAAFLLVAIYVVSHTLSPAERGPLLISFVLVCTASWLAEESCILLYEFYGYSLNWRLCLAHLPLPVIVIWPVIVHSAWDLASQILRPGHRLVPLTAAAVVLTDALLIEPVGVRTGLWSWKGAGLFDVPPIGILGWAYFAFWCSLFFEERKQRHATAWVNLLILMFSVIGTHGLLLGTWWAALRWVKIPINPMFAVGSAWILSLLLVSSILKHRTGIRIRQKTLLLRLMGALSFFTWFALHAKDSTLLIVYAVAFAPPYLTLMMQQYLLPSPGRIRGYPGKNKRII